MSQPWTDDLSPSSSADGATSAFPRHRDRNPTHRIKAGAYSLSFAHDAEELEQALRLRYRVFNEELNEGLAESEATGRDEDQFDADMHHLLVWHTSSAQVIGTYRLQTAAAALSGQGLYTQGEFDLSTLPTDVLASAIEIGRACIDKGHRRGRVLHLLWKGLAEYMKWNDSRFLFGCCSLTGLDPDLGISTHQHLVDKGHAHPSIGVLPKPDFVCTATGSQLPAPDVPTLFRSYLDIGVKVCSPPALDVEFNTTDFFVLLDTEELSPILRRAFFG